MKLFIFRTDEIAIDGKNWEGGLFQEFTKVTEKKKERKEKAENKINVWCSNCIETLTWKFVLFTILKYRTFSKRSAYRKKYLITVQYVIVKKYTHSSHRENNGTRIEKKMHKILQCVFRQTHCIHRP